MGVFQRIFGISVTSKPSDEGCFAIEDGIVRVDLARAPELASPGSALRLESAELPDRLMVLHGIDGTFRAYTNHCACSGWRIDPVPGEHKVRCCTMARSTYDYDGVKLSGPAKADLTTHPVEKDGDTLVIRPPT
jgi:nitrite reductase/ring-hydroxylating ferredoxin subunit